MKKKYVVWGMLGLLGVQYNTILHVNANESSANVLSAPIRVGSVITHDDIKYKVLSINNNQINVQLGNDYSVQFKAEHHEKPFVVPESFTQGNQTFTVTEIGEDGLAYYPDELGSITYYPKSITIPKTVQTIKKRAFSGSKAETVLFEKGSQLKEIEDSVFTNSEVKQIKLPSSLKVLGKKAFNFSERLENIEFENGSQLTEIKDEAFSNLSKLKKIILPSQLERIGKYPFRYSTGIENVEIDASNAHYTTDDGVLYTKDKTTLIYYPAKKLGTSYTTAPETKIIEGYAFTNNASLENLELNEGVEQIGTFAFSGIKLLKHISMPATLKRIEKLAFFENMALKELHFPDNVEDFEKYTVSGLPKLEKVTLGKNIKTIPDKFLSGTLDNLREIYIHYDKNDFMLNSESFEVPEKVVFKVANENVKNQISATLGNKHQVIVEMTTNQPVPPADVKPEGQPAPPTAGQPADAANPSKEVQPADATNPSKNAQSADATNPSKNAQSADATNPSKNAQSADAVNPSKEAQPADAVNPSKEAQPADAVNPSKEAQPADVANPSKGAQSVDVANPSNHTEPLRHTVSTSQIGNNPSGNVKDTGNGEAQVNSQNDLTMKSASFQKDDHMPVKEKNDALPYTGTMGSQNLSVLGLVLIGLAKYAFRAKKIK